MLKTHQILLLLGVVLLLSPAVFGKINTTEDLIQAMQKSTAAAGTRLLPSCKTTEFHADGTSKISTWYEAMSVPGSLRIDFAPVKDGNGILFAGGKIYSFKDGKAESSRPFTHPLLILGFDIYSCPRRKW